MAYEIPQELKYEEKVLFGLTIEQFSFIAVFALLAALIYFKTELFFELKLFLVTLLVFFGLGFAFFDFKNYLVNLFNFYQSPRNVGYLDNKIKKFIEVKEVKNDIIYLKNNCARAVLQVQPINFGIKSDAEKELIIQNFQEFLNSLSFPVQILMRTVNMNLDGFMDSLERSVDKAIKGSRNKNLKEIFGDYKLFMEKFIEKKAIQDRLFYIIVPLKVESGEIEKHEFCEKEFEIRLTQLIEKISAVGLTTKRLNTNQLISLLASFFEGFVEVENDYLFPVTILEKYKGVESFE